MHLRFALAAAAAFLVFVSTAPRLEANQVAGKLFDIYGEPVANAPVGAQKLGEGGPYTFGGAATNAGDPVGQFYFPSLQGTFSLAFGHADQYPRKFLFNVLGGKDAYIWVNETINYPGGAPIHFPNFAQEFGQQFQALGDSVTSVSAKFPAPTTAVVTIHEGGINGPQVGPQRLMQGNFTNDSMACWSAGEVPTVPGQLYTIRWREVGGGTFSLNYYAARCLGGEVFPGAKTWAGGNEFPLGIRTVIGMDTDGISSTVNTSVAPSARNAQYVSSVAGQSFTARGSSVVGATFAFGTDSIYEATIFRSPGPDGQGVDQISPTKWLRGIAWNSYSVVTWSRDEASVIPGQQYYLRLKRIGGGGFTIYRTNTDEYMGGQMYVDGTPLGLDFSGLICEEKEAGSGSRQPVSATLPTVTGRTSTSATLNWSASPAGTTLVEYGETPYTDSVQVQSSTVQQTLTLTNLKPGTLYHARITATAEGRLPGRGRDIVFVTEPATPNLLTNGGFEAAGLAGWTSTGYAPTSQHFPATGTGDFFGVKAHSGNRLAALATQGGKGKGVLYQRVAVDSSRPVSLRAFFWSWQNKYFGGGPGYMTLGRICIDPTGGTNPASVSVKWSEWYSGQDWFGDQPSRWTDNSITAQPVAGHVTVFLEAGRDVASDWMVYGWDDIALYQPANEAVEVSRLADLASHADGTVVEVPGLIVTATRSEVGDNYLQSPDRSGAIRAESAVDFSPGASVTVQGSLQTTPAGERYLADAQVSASSASALPESLGVRNAALAEVSQTPSLTALLVRSWGRVTASAPGEISIQDGSSSGPLRVRLPAAVPAPPLGAWVEVTGVGGVEGTSPESARMVLLPRNADDVNMVD